MSRRAMKLRDILTYTFQKCKAQQFCRVFLKGWDLYAVFCRPVNWHTLLDKLIN